MGSLRLFLHPLMSLKHSILAYAILLLFTISACKTYEKSGGLSMMSRFNNTAFDLPTDFTLYHYSKDTSIIYVHVAFSDYNKSKRLQNQITLYSQIRTDLSTSDKFLWNPIQTTQFILNTTRDTTLVIPGSIRMNEKGWLQVKLFTADSSIYVKKVMSFDKEHLWNDAFYLITDTLNQIIHPSYLRLGKTYLIHHYSAFDTLIAEYFPFYPTPAAPIFFSNANSGLPLHSDSSIKFLSSSGISFLNGGFYEIHRSIDSIGLHVLVHDSNFPNLETAQDLIEPLRYISRNEEYDKLMHAHDIKSQLDSFWVTRCEDINIARRAIKAYYNRVEFANRHFTTYRDGWKTDPGIVYIMFGPPQRCYTFKAGEIWIYSNLSAQTEFVFIHRSSPYYSGWLELKRESDYYNLWNIQSFKWRTGKIISEPQ